MHRETPRPNWLGLKAVVTTGNIRSPRRTLGALRFCARRAQLHVALPEPEPEPELEHALGA